MTAVAPRPLPPSAHQHPAADPAPQVSTPAAVQDNRFRTVQLALFTAGAVLMPLGVIAVCIGWYGAAHTRYSYDQFPYLISGGVLGLALTFVGGFLYFGAWLARIGQDQRAAAQQLSDTMLVLADLVSRSGADAGVADDAGAVPVLAGEGTTVHRRDCALIAHRPDLHALTGEERGLSECRVCRPHLG